MIPYDHEAEQIVLAAAATNRQDRDRILARLTADDFHHPDHKAAFTAIVDLHAEGLRVDALAVARKSGTVDAAALLRSLATFPDEAIATVADTAWRRRLIHAGGEIATAAKDTGRDISELAQWSMSLLERAEAPVLEADDLTDVADLAAENHDHDWLVPGLLERGDRMILTGMEGHGKSTALRSWAYALACGRHPFNLTSVRKVRVLLVDLENSRRQLSRAFQSMPSQLVYEGGMAVSCFTAGLDVRSLRDAQRLDALVENHRAELVVIGPLYKAFRTRRGESKNDETAAEEAAFAFDRLRARHGCALWIEAHAPHGDSGDRAGLRPYGASLWLRWPEFGFGLKPIQDSVAGRRMVELKAWRGVRERGREWPERLVEGTVLPWAIA
jgi:hypothetical protein